MVWIHDATFHIFYYERATKFVILSCIKAYYLIGVKILGFLRDAIGE